MTRSEPIAVGNTAQNEPIVLVFLHTDNGTVHAEITAWGVPGMMTQIREGERSWVLLEDTIDRDKLLRGPFVPSVQFDVEEAYMNYIVGLIVT